MKLLARILVDVYGFACLGFAVFNFCNLDKPMMGMHYAIAFAGLGFILRIPYVDRPTPPGTSIMETMAAMTMLVTAWIYIARLPNKKPRQEPTNGVCS